MALKKVEYVDKVTVITAENLNNIQDNIILNKKDIDELIEKPDIVVSKTEPESPKIGDIWYNPEDQEALNIDNTPTTDSLNLVFSGGVAEKLNEKIEIVKLWENPNPTAEFTAQTILINSENFSCFQVVFLGYRSDIDGELYLSSGILPKGLTKYVLINPYGNNDGEINFQKRSFTVTDSEFIFEESSYCKTLTNANAGSSNNVCIPTVIYGIKGVR